MAVFYYPTRDAPTTTLTIASLENMPSERIKEKMQSIDQTPGGVQIIYNLGGTIEYLPIKIKALSSANKTSLLSFIETTVNYQESTFDFDDDADVEYNTCRFATNRTAFNQITDQRFSEEILIRLGP